MDDRYGLRRAWTPCASSLRLQILLQDVCCAFNALRLFPALCPAPVPFACSPCTCTCPTCWRLKHLLVFSGGPGCSSEIAIFYENGPYSINEDSATLTETKYGGQGCLLAAP